MNITKSNILSSCASRNTKYLYLTLFYFFLQGCGSTREINYSGLITKNSVAPIVGLIADGQATRLSIRSPGGDGEASLALAEAISKYNVAVEAYDYCMSGCTLVFIASKKRSMRPKTALLFHWGARYNYEILRAELGENASDTKIAAALAERERNIYVTGKIKVQMIADTIRLISPTCAGIVKEHEKIETYSITDLRNISFDQTQLKDYGFAISDVKNTYNDAQTLGLRAEMEPDWGNVGFVSRVKGDIDPILFKNLPDCTSSQKAALAVARASYYKAVDPRANPPP